jgi:hypothetical protein
MKKSVHNLGFYDCGEPLAEFESGGITVFVQPVCCNITKDLLESWLQRKHELETSFYKKNLGLVVEFPQ